MKMVEMAFFSKNVAAMVDFYRQFLGQEPVAQSDDMAIFMSGDTKIFIHRQYKPGAGELPPENHVAFGVTNVDETCRRLTAVGLTLEVPPENYYWGRSAYLRNPDGQLIEIIEETPAVES